MTDSYTKFANDMLSGCDHVFRHVRQEDLDEVKVAFALMVSDLEYANNYRAFPDTMWDEYELIKRKGCCGSWNTSVRCASGKNYLIGCNFGH